MTWIYRGEDPHECEPPVIPVKTFLGWFNRCDVTSWSDIWQCDKCYKYWVPTPGSVTSHWDELKGWKLRRRLRKIRTPE